ncbi:hypothetical protein VE03_00636 [Pseudogymnoascus sp. 23342-1-I1]|nr:hypothetical protein VE03_00636 [Pseudogymnoascus sp. 23342-1-I1]
MDQLISFIKRQSGDVTVPNVCFATCNNALTVAQQIGKLPALCGPDSAFLNYYGSCKTCIEANGSGTVQGNGSESSQATSFSAFAQFLSYCDLEPLATSTTSFTLTDGAVSTIFFLVQETSSASNASSASSSTERTWTATTSSSTASPTISPTLSSATSATVPSSSTKSKAWIAGPVIGCTALLALILGLLLYLRKRGRKTTIAHNESGSPYEKAELHADEVKKPVYETETHEIHEVEGSSPQPAEKPANETLMELAAVEAKREGDHRDNETK